MDPSSAQVNQNSSTGATPPAYPPPQNPISPQAEAAAERKLLKPIAITLLAVTGLLIVLTTGLVIFGQKHKVIRDISQQVIPPQI